MVKDFLSLADYTGDEILAFLDFADRLERRFIGQGLTNRTIEETLELAWALLDPLPAELLTRIPGELIHRHRGEAEVRT